MRSSQGREGGREGRKGGGVCETDRKEGGREGGEILPLTSTISLSSKEPIRCPRGPPGGKEGGREG